MRARTVRPDVVVHEVLALLQRPRGGRDDRAPLARARVEVHTGARRRVCEKSRASIEDQKTRAAPAFQGGGAQRTEALLADRDHCRARRETGVRRKGGHIHALWFGSIARMYACQNATTALVEQPCRPTNITHRHLVHPVLDGPAAAGAPRLVDEIPREDGGVVFVCRAMKNNVRGGVSTRRVSTNRLRSSRCTHTARRRTCCCGW